MIDEHTKTHYYQVFLDKDPEYDGIFFVGVKTTGIFCRPTCPARKPKLVNCEFFSNAQEALLASFRPCKRCQPLSHPNHVSPLVQKLVQAVEANPEKRWKNADFEALSVDASTARRQFQKRFGMTFVEYARARRMGLAMESIRKGDHVIAAQLDAGYESGSGFRDAFSRIIGQAPSKATETCFIAKWIDTQLGPMLAIADVEKLFLLEFVSRRGLEREIERLRAKYKRAIVPGDNAILQSIAKEVDLYFQGKLTQFLTPYELVGTPFQKTVWKALLTIPTGSTVSYSELAKQLKKPSAFRAVANANGANQLAIVIPCHRVINQNGELGGYGGGLARKQWLLEHEVKYQSDCSKKA